MAGSIGTALADKVVENLVDRILNFILNPITVVRKCNENVQNLKNQVEALENKNRSVKRYIEGVGRRGEEIGEEVQAWLTKADKLIKPAGESIRVGDEFANNECFFRLCPNPLPRYKLSKKAAQITEDIAILVQEVRGFDFPLSHAPPPQQDVAAVVEGFEEFPSRMAVLEQIMEALRNPLVNKIGVYGTSGMGKTTVVKMVRGKAKQDSLFNVVVMATVTKDRDLKSILEDIARDLGRDRLSFREDTDRQVAALIKAELMKKKKFLVILDDVWETEIDFEKFGIPSASEMKQAIEKESEENLSGQEDMLCKILVTSRFHDVLSGIMGEKDKLFEVQKLQNDEAWHLFKKIVGSNIESSDFQPKAKEIVEKCLGLPVAIVSVGKAMKGKTQQFEWDDALTELKKPSPDGISAAVYKPITLEKLKWISLPNGDIELPANGLHCPQLTFFYLYNKAQSLEVPLELFRKADGLKVLCLTKIDFKSRPSPIPFIPMNLHSLLLDQCAFKVKDLGAIVGNLENLKVLSLAGCDIEEWPREIEKLTKLKLLDVSDCTKLRVIPRRALASLSRSLEELKMGNSFNQWDVEEGNARLDELAELHKLTALEVHIPNFRAISFPENLRRFKIFLGGVRSSWDSSFESSKIMKLKLKGASIKSDESVKKLLKKTEGLYLEDLSGVESLVDGLDDEGFQHLKRLEVQSAPDIRCIFNPAGRLLLSHVFPILQVLTLFNLEKMEKICHGLTGAAPFKVLRKITVVSCHQLKNLFSFSMARQLQLQEITVRYCNNIEEIIDDVEEQGSGNDIVEESEGCKLGGSLRSLRLEWLPELISFFNSGNCSNISLFNDKVAFPNLEELQISWINVNTIWHTSIISHAGNLTKLNIKGCHNLEYLLSSSMVTILAQLERLQIRECKRMTNVIFSEDVEENKNLIFPWLNFLSMNYLQNLESFDSGNCVVKFPFLEQLEIMNCPRLEGFTVKSTRTIVATNIQPLFNEQVDYSQLGKHVSVLGNLEALTVHFCETLISLSTSTVPFQTLTTLEVSHCKWMINLVSISTAQSLVNLKSMIVSYCHKLTEIVGNEGDGTQDSINFTKLTYLKLEGLTKLASFCSGNSNLEFPSLELVIVHQCPQLLKFYREDKLDTPVLKCVQLIAGEDKWRWAGNLNTTIEQMYIEKDGYAGLQNLILSDFPEVMESWHRMRLQEMSHFRLIQDLKICGCSNFKCLLTPSLALAFVELKKLEVINCGTMEQVIVGEWRENQIIFLHLRLIILESCSDMTSFYVGSQNLRIPALLHIYVKDCPKIVTFAASTFLGGHEKEAFRYFFSSKVEIPLLNTLDLCSISVQKIWHDELPSMSSLVQSLRKLTVRDSGNLKYLFTSSMVSSFVQLEVLEIFECQLMEVVILIKDWKDEERVRQMPFPKLNVFELLDLPQFIKFCGTCNSLVEISEPQGLMNGSGSQILSPTRSPIDSEESSIDDYKGGDDHSEEYSNDGSKEGSDNGFGECSSDDSDEGNDNGSEEGSYDCSQED